MSEGRRKRRPAGGLAGPHHVEGRGGRRGEAEGGRPGGARRSRRAGSASKSAGRERADGAEVTVTLTNTYGLHMRPAGEVVKLANSFPCEIRLTVNGVEVDAKSVLGLITLEAQRGDEVLVRAEGKRAAEAVAGLAKLLASLPEFDKEQLAQERGSGASDGGRP